MSNTVNEDCLFQNVFAPSNAHPNSKLPVWFQGGGYAANSDQNFNASEVIVRANHSMVFGQLNYRVGAFGFLASEKIPENGDLNIGLLDQQKALLWARKYIHLARCYAVLIWPILTSLSGSAETQTTSLYMAIQQVVAPSPTT